MPAAVAAAAAAVAAASDWFMHCRRCHQIEDHTWDIIHEDDDGLDSDDENFQPSRVAEQRLAPPSHSALFMGHRLRARKADTHTAAVGLCHACTCACI